MNRSLRSFIVIIFLFFAYSFSAIVMAQQNVNYNDVGVIYNVNDSGSHVIANYFMSKRNIPSQNLIPINVQSAEEISDSVIQIYELQVQNYLATHHLDT